MYVLMRCQRCRGVGGRRHEELLLRLQLLLLRMTLELHLLLRLLLEVLLLLMLRQLLVVGNGVVGLWSRNWSRGRGSSRGGSRSKSDGSELFLLLRFCSSS